jgi:hypothetical protein
MLRSPDVEASTEFLLEVGLRAIETADGIAVLELRGGTHLIVLASEEPIAAGAQASFDLMVDDIEASRDRYSALGFAPSELVVETFHTRFTLVEPGGHTITVNSSHASDMPI